ncbi:MAG: phosphate ABC transporter permease subunit PstC [Asgard group archaeon]|nr:phosphate ABC transporter permease subunit PstC [Asgard group archaeon]
MSQNQIETIEEPTIESLEEDESTSEGSILEIGKQKISWQRIVLMLFAGISVIVVILIFIFILVNGLQVIPEVGFIKFLFGTSWNPAADQYGILHGIIGTVMVVLIAMVVAVPISISCSIYMSEIAPQRIRKILKPSVEMLASIPSIVYGFFGLFILVPAVKYIFGLPTGENALSGGLILAIMVIPTIVSITDDAIRAVPSSFREASLALGATKWQTIRKVVLPAALSGITVAVILAFGRAIGETMAVLMVAGGASQIPKPFFNILVPVDPLTAIIARELGEAAQGDTQFHALFGIAIVLFMITFVVNLTGDLIIKRFTKKFRGA